MAMHIHLHIHDHRKEGDEHKEIMSFLNILKLQNNKIIMTNAELSAKLDAANTKVDKIIVEVQALKDLVGTTPDVPQNIVDAVTALEAKLQAADDLNADATTEG